MTDLTKIIKSDAHFSVAESVYSEISQRSAKYFYFLSNVVSNIDSAAIPSDDFNYENSVRSEIVVAKQIKSSDVSFVIRKISWEKNFVYDIYDDRYSQRVLGVNLTDGGSGYNTIPKVYIGSQGSLEWSATTSFNIGDMINSNGNYYIVKTSGISGTIPPQDMATGIENGTLILDFVNVSDGFGTGATAEATISGGKIIDISLIDQGYSYVNRPSVIIASTSDSGIGAICETVMAISVTGEQNLHDTNFYVMSQNFNVYKCLNNNFNNVSTVEPYGTDYEPIITSDGYVWKYLYTVPPALRNKFVTENYIPIVSSLNNNFYSNGSISSVKINNHGADYDYARINVAGDGFLEKDPFILNSFNIDNVGSGYSTLTMQVDPPFDKVVDFVSSSNYFAGEKIRYNYNIYEAVTSGTTSSSTFPTHRYGSALNGSVVLNFIGTQINGTISLSGNSIGSVDLYGCVSNLQIFEAGSGYLTAPIVTVNGGSGTGVLIKSKIYLGSLISLEIIDQGVDFLTTPNVIIGEEWVASTSYSLNQQIFYNSNLYTVTVAGTSGSTAPSHTSGSVANGSCTLTYAGVAATATCSIKYGSGYSSAPTITLTGDGTGAAISLVGAKSEAIIYPILNLGQIVGVEIVDGGIGYTKALLEVVGNGQEAELLADTNIGMINSNQANVELLDVAGAIYNLPIISQGYGYSSATITIVGDGSGAVATPVLQNGNIIGINVTSYGSGYKWAKVFISGDGFGAKARAIISPYLGHTKNCFKSMLPRTLMIYSDVSSEKVQGLEVVNKFRQVGILKSPRDYLNKNLISNNLVYGCFLIDADNNVTNFPENSIVFVTYNSYPRRFRIIKNTGTKVLLQSLDNYEPIIGSVFINQNNQNFIAKIVTKPSLDKYSGELIYIDNREAFTASSDQAIVLRTIITY